jgi:transcriptional regulator with XRE-family HTH domain
MWARLFLPTRFKLLFLSKIDKYNSASQMKENFGAYIRHLRKSNGLTLTQLAAKLDMDSANLSKVENEKRIFDEKKLPTLAKIFDLDLKGLKTEFYSDKIARELYYKQCSQEVLQVAEEKIEYLKQQNQKQDELKFK